MEKEIKEKVTRILDDIDEDKIIPEDPFFHIRLMAKVEEHFSFREKKNNLSSFWIKLRPVLAAAAIIFGICAGIFSGNRLSMVKHKNKDLERSVQLEQFARESFINEINGSPEDQLLSK